MPYEFYERRYRLEIWNPHFPKPSTSISSLSAMIKPGSSPSSPLTGFPGGGVGGSGTMADLLKAIKKQDKSPPADTIADLATVEPKFVAQGYYNDDGIPGFYCEWEITYSLEQFAPTGSVSIYNLTDETIATFKKFDILKLYAGYRGTSMPLICLAEIKMVDTDWQGGDKVTKIDVNDSAYKWQKEMALREPLKKPEMASEVVADLLKKQSMPYEFTKVGTEHTYENGKHYNLDISYTDALASIAGDTDSKCYVLNGTIIFRPLNSGIKTDIIVSNNPTFKTLIGLPRYLDTTKGQGALNERPELKITILLDGRLNVDRIFYLDSRDIQAMSRITTCKYLANKHDYYNEMEIRMTGVEQIKNVVKPIDVLNYQGKTAGPQATI